MTLASIDGDLAWHSGERDHDLNVEAGEWFCATCERIGSAQERLVWGKLRHAAGNVRAAYAMQHAR